MIALLPWAASLLTLVAVWCLGREDTRFDGWATGGVSNALWFVYACATGQLALLLLNVVLWVFHLRGLLHELKERDQCESEST